MTDISPARARINELLSKFQEDVSAFEADQSEVDECTVITVDEILRRIRARKLSHSPAVEVNQDDDTTVERQYRLQSWTPLYRDLDRRGVYSLPELTNFDDSVFVRNAYHALLKREPDTEGASAFLEALRNGSMSKVAIINAIKYSDEGVRAGVEVLGLKWPGRLERWQGARGIGPIVAWVRGIARLHTLSRRIELQGNRQHQELFKLGASYNQLVQKVNGEILRIDESVRSLDNQLHSIRAEQAQRAGECSAQIESELDSIRKMLAQLNNEGELRIASARREMTRDLESLANSLRLVDSDNKRIEMSIESARREVARELESLTKSVRSIDSENKRMDLRITSARNKVVADLESLSSSVKLVDSENKGISSAFDGVSLRVDAINAALEKSSKHVLSEARKFTEQSTARAVQLFESHQSTALSQLELVKNNTQMHFESINKLNATREVIEERLQRLKSNFDEQIKGIVSVQISENRQQSDELARRIELAEKKLSELQADKSRIAAELADSITKTNQTLMNQSDLLDKFRGEALVRIEGDIAALKSATEEIRSSGTTDNEFSSAELDAMYARFEDTFRGDPENIRDRVRYIIEIIRNAGLGNEDSPVLDLGSGRGEWLQLLRDSGHYAFGIDNNSTFVADCKDAGLDVLDGDVNSEISKLADESVGAITSMHLIEHIPFESLVALVDESLRTLRTGGFILLETPNPENIEVGSHYFYLDPTHRNPLPPSTVKWLLEDRGFSGVSVIHLAEHRYFEVPDLVSNESENAEALNRILSGYRAAPDYAVIGWKR